MAKYNYDKAALSGLGVGGFLSQVKVRQAHIDEAGTEIPTSVYNPNRLAKAIHPEYLLGRVKEVQPIGPLKRFVIEPFTEAGFTEFPPFRAGQYLSFEFELGEKYACRTYCLASSPKVARETNTYEILVNGALADPHDTREHICTYIHQNWQPGTIVCFSSPLGGAYYEPLRDAKRVLMLGMGASNIATAEAIADGVEDFNVTLLNIFMTPTALCGDRFREAERRSNGKVKFVPVLMNGTAPGFESAPITEDLFKKYLTDPATGELIDTTVFLSGPPFMVEDWANRLKALGLPQKRIRKEFHGELTFLEQQPDYPKDTIGKTFRLRVWSHGEYRDLDCPADTPLLRVMEDAGIHVMSDCHSGLCGWCHSRWIDGTYYMPKSHDGRREADRKFGWIHPCCTYALSDMEIEVFPRM